MVQLLLDRGAKLEAKDEWGKTPLDLALVGEHAEVAMLLAPAHTEVGGGSGASIIAYDTEIIGSGEDIKITGDDSGGCCLIM